MYKSETTVNNSIFKILYITIYQIIKILHFLYFRVRPEHVEQGIKLECTAAIGAVFWQSFQEKIPVIPRIEKSTSSSNWWRSSSGASSSSSFVQHVANLILGKQKIILRDLKVIYQVLYISILKKL